MTAAARRAVVVRRLAFACAALVLAITSLSAFVRLSRAGAACTPWPQCYEQRAGSPGLQRAEQDPPAIGAARAVHRVVATAALGLVIALLVMTLARQPALASEGRLALALLGVALFLAVLGRAAGESRSVPVVLGNVLGGHAMLALAALLAAPPSKLPARLVPWVAAAAALVVLQIAAGAAIDSRSLAAQCGSVGLCAAHRVLGLATAAIVVAVGIAVWRAGLRLGGVAAALVVLQAVLGWLFDASGRTLVLLVAHNAAAALLLATFAVLLRRKQLGSESN